MSRTLLIVALAVVFCIGLGCEIQAQDTGQRTRDLVAALDKTKYKKKEKKNVSVEVYVDIRNEPVVKKNVTAYSGVYEDTDAMYRLELRVAADGTAEGSGYDSDVSKKLPFTLKNARIDGALLTGTKVFENGETETLDALFTNQTASHGTNPAAITSRETKYGLAFIQSHSNWTNRVLLEPRGR